MAQAGAEVLAQITNELGRSAASPRPAEVRPATDEDAIDGILPTVMVRAFAEEHVATVVKFAYERHLCIAPRGSGSQMHWGGVPSRIDIIVDLSGLNAVVDYEPDDMTITVQAGCTLSQVQEVLAAHRQFLPIDPPLSPQATIGGLLATRAAGPLRLGYGTLRDYILGARVVRSNGEVANAGGRVVKNVAGYELCKLYTGSFGSLAIFLEATFKVRPLPDASGIICLPLPRLQAAEPVVTALLDTTIEPSLLELFNQKAVRRLGQELPEGCADAPYTLFIGFSGPKTVVSWQVEHTLETIASLPTPTKRRLGGHAMPWDATYRALLEARKRQPDTLVCRANVLSSEVAPFIDRAEAVLRAHGSEAPVFAHAGSGIVHLYLDAAPDDPSELVQQLIEAASARPTAPSVPPMISAGRGQALQGAIRAAAAADLPGLGELERLRAIGTGNLVIESASARHRRRLPVWGRSRPDEAYLKALKERFDPRAILNPGRSVGG